LATKAGAVVVDNTSFFRMDPNVPLVVPEVNPGEIAKYKRRVAADSEAGEVKILAGLNADGEGAILVSAFKSELTSLKLEIKGAKATNLEVLCVNSDLNFEPVEFKAGGDAIVLEKKPGSSVFLVRGLNSAG